MFRRMIKLTLFPSTSIQGGTSDIPEELLGNSYSINLPFIERKPPVFNLRCITNSPNTHFIMTNMEFVKKFTPPDFQAKNFTPSISPNFNSFSKKKHKK